MMSVATVITRAIDFFYVAPICKFVPQRVFRYGACGALNIVLDALWYFFFYHFVVCKRFVSFPFVTISPHIFCLLCVFPITFFTGFWLNRHVAFRTVQIAGGRQLCRYALTVAGSLLLNYMSMKLLVEHAGLWATPSKVATTLICTVYSYLAGRYYTFTSR